MRGVSSTGYILSRNKDALFFILTPLLSLAIGFTLGPTRLGTSPMQFGLAKGNFLYLFAGVFTLSHLILVFARSHGNADIYKSFRFRFTWVPLLLLLSIRYSPVVFACAAVLAVWWDVYHSSLQTFGIGRIYDARAGNDPHVGRKWDLALNLIIYSGPIFAGASLIDHVGHFKNFEKIGWTLFSGAAPFLLENQRIWFGLLAIILVVFLLFYVQAYRKFCAQGYRMPIQKYALFGSTFVTSVLAWGLNPFGQAFFIMNFFHSLQYFALVLWAESENVKLRMRLGSVAQGTFAVGLGMVLFCLTYGFLARGWSARSPWFFSAALTISLLHFWYDGFIWSVRRQI